MECPNCGFTLEENDAFCSNCGKYALPLQNADHPAPVTEPPETPPEDAGPEPVPEEEAPKRPKKVAARLYPAPDIAELLEPEPIPEPEPEPEPASVKALRNPRRTIRRLRVVTVIFGLLAAAAVALAAYTIISSSSLQVQLNKAQRESLTAQSSALDKETEITTLSKELEDAQAERDELAQQIAELTGQIGTLETSINQNQYDKESAERNLGEIQTQLTTLQEERDELQASLTTAEADLEEAQEALDEALEINDTLSAQVEGYRTKVQFYDDSVVFVMVGSTDMLYHKYDCEEFTQRNFLAYNPRLAEANGYSPCPECIG